MKKSILTAALALVSVLACSAQGQYAFTSKPSVNVRNAPSTSATKVGALKADVLVPLLEADYESGWNKIEFEGRPAYVSQSVTEVCDAAVPKSMLGKYVGSSKPLDSVRFEGGIEITPLDKTHALIYVEWMRTNAPADMWAYIADMNADGSIVATHSLGGGYRNAADGYVKLMEDAEKLDEPSPVGFDEFNETLYFDGGVYSSYE